MFNIIKTVLDVIKQYRLKTVCSIVQHNSQDGKKVSIAKWLSV